MDVGVQNPIVCGFYRPCDRIVDWRYLDKLGLCIRNDAGWTQLYCNKRYTDPRVLYTRIRLANNGITIFLTVTNSIVYKDDLTT